MGVNSIIKLVEMDKGGSTLIKLDTWNFSFDVPFETLEVFTIEHYDMSVSEFVEEYTYDDAERVYRSIQEQQVQVEAKSEPDNKEQVYSLQEWQVVLHYDHLDLACEANYNDEAILTKQELREYAISQFHQYEDFGMINFWELDVTVKLTRVVL